MICSKKMARIFSIQYFLLFTLLYSCGQSKEKVSFPSTDISIPFSQRADTLIQLSQKIHHAKNQKSLEEYHQLFFQFFPNSFALLDSLYGYEEETGPSLLYNEAMSHIIETFFKLDNVSVEDFAQRTIEISLKGSWEADAINYFQYGLRNNTKSNIELYCKLLSKYSDDDIYSFWYFYFDGPHPENVKPDYESLLAEVKQHNAKIAGLMECAFKKLRLEKSH